jgi:uncharacterized protein (DUF433 family)
MTGGARDWDEWISIDPAVQGGRPVVKGTRMPVETIVGSLAGGMTVEEVCEQYRLTAAQVRAALRYAAQSVASERVTVVA